MVTFLRLYQGGMGVGHLPELGGVMDQSVLMIDALTLMDAFERKLNDKDAEPLDESGGVDYAEKDRRAAASWGIGV